MCGIIGYITKGEQYDRDGRRSFLNQALYVDTMRGFDSTGLIVVDRKFEVRTIKSTLPGSKFIVSKPYTEFNTDGWCAIGHNRAATQGSVKYKNAHPFVCGPIAMVHNGTLSDSGKSMVHQHAKLEVDSAIIAYNLSMVPPEEAKDVLGRLKGGYAIVWTDTRDKTVNIARNDSRPFHFGYNSAKTVMLFMSDPYMLNMVCNRPFSRATAVDAIFRIGAMQQLKFKKGSMKPEVIKVENFIQAFPVVRRGDSGWRRPTGMQPKTYTETPMKPTGNISSQTFPPVGLTRRRNTLPSMGQAVINGDTQRIPKSHIEMLQIWFGTPVLNPIQFAPDEYVPWDERKGMVYGSIVHVDWQETYMAVVYDVWKNAYDNHKDMSWTTAPIGMSYSTIHERNAECFILRPMQYVWNENSLPRNSNTAATVIGPNGKLIPKWKWLELTDEGCEQCGGVLALEDHAEVMWAGEYGSQPICGSCADYLTNPNSEGH